MMATAKKTAAKKSAKKAPARTAKSAKASSNKTSRTKTSSKKTSAPAADAPKLIDARIKELGDWRGKVLAQVRKVIRAADPGIVEEWKWGVPVWSAGGIICTGETYKSAVKLTFAKGASLKDPSRLFNSSLDGNTRRALDIHDGAEIDENALTALVREAVVLNTSKK